MGRSKACSGPEQERVGSESSEGLLVEPVVGSECSRSRLAHGLPQGSPSVPVPCSAGVGSFALSLLRAEVRLPVVRAVLTHGQRIIAVVAGRVSLLLELRGGGAPCGGVDYAWVRRRVDAGLSVGGLQLRRHPAVEVCVARRQRGVLGRGSGKRRR